MKSLRLTLKVSKLNNTTHIWFPAAPQAVDEEIKSWFSVAPTEIQTDEKFGNKIAYFYFPEKNSITMYANFPISDQDSLPTAPDKFLHPNRFVQSDDTAIINIAKLLTKNYLTDEDKVRHCFDFVVRYLSYANPIRGLYSSIQALIDRGVDCGGFSTLLVALLRAVKIPARCVFGWAIRSKLGYHAWVEYFDRQKNLWIPADPSAANLENRTKLDAGFGFINDERVRLSVGEDIDLAGNKINWTAPLLQSPVVVSFDHQEMPSPIVEGLKWAVI